MDNHSNERESFAPARKSLRARSAMSVSDSSLANGVVIVDRNNRIADALESKNEGLAGTAILHDLVFVGLPVKGNQKFTKENTSPRNNYLGNPFLYNTLNIDYSLPLAA